MFAYHDINGKVQDNNAPGQTLRLRHFLLVLIRLLGGKYRVEELYLVAGGKTTGEWNDDKAGVKWSGCFHDPRGGNQA